MTLKFEEAYDQYLIYIENRQKSQSKRTLKERFNNRILPFWKDYNIYDITEIDYMSWQNYVDSYNYSNNYRSGLHYLMTTFFDYCVKYHGLSSNIARIVGNFKLKNERRIVKYYTYKDFRKFIKYISDDIYKQFFILMFFTGTRPGEAMALRFSDLHKYYIDINKTVSEHGDREEGTPKSKSSYRQINIYKKMYNNLNLLREHYISLYNNNSYDYYIFGGIKPLAPTTLRRKVKEASRLANIHYIKLHEFRHSHASLLNKQHFDALSIKERLGHSDISVTMNVYVHRDDSQEKRVARTLNLLRLFKPF